MTSNVEAVVLNWHDDLRTQRCVESLQREPTISRITVVNNEAAGTSGPYYAPGSADYERRRADLVVIDVAENRGFAAGINVALRERRDRGASAPVLVINNDAELLDGALLEMLSMLEADASIGIVGPVLLNPDGRIQSRGYRVSRLTGIARANKKEGMRIDYLTWACVLISDGLLRAVGGLDERYFMYWEDADFGARVLRSGYKPALCGRAFARHELSASADKAAEKLVLYYAWGLRVYMEGLTGLSRFRCHVAIWLLRASRIARLDIHGLGAINAGWGRPVTWPAYLSFPISLA